MLERWEGVDAGEWATRLALPHVEFHDELGSTNDRAKELAASAAPVPALVVADRQTAGRGRHGRAWSSDHPGGLWMSLTDGGGDLTGLLPLVAGVAVARGVEASLGERGAVMLALKWPNDVYAGGRKLAGVLCEGRGEEVIVGIGVNVNQSAGELPAGADVPPVSIRVLTGTTIGRGRVLEGIVAAWAELRTSLDRARVDSGPARFPEELLQELNRRSAVRDAPVAVQGTARHSNGRLGRIDDDSARAGAIQPDGALVVHTGGQVVEMIAGTVRLLQAPIEFRSAPW